MALLFCTSSRVSLLVYNECYFYDALSRTVSESMHSLCPMQCILKDTAYTRNVSFYYVSQPIARSKVKANKNHPFFAIGPVLWAPYHLSHQARCIFSLNEYYCCWKWYFPSRVCSRMAFLHRGSLDNGFIIFLSSELVSSSTWKPFF